MQNNKYVLKLLVYLINKECILQNIRISEFNLLLILWNGILFAY
jgi:hypothetical protein